MARQPRLEYPGALYHIISRGNYRKPVFDEGGGAAFEKALFQACSKCGWLFHAYVIMNNHYHLAVETPQANLVDGMRWLQGTFAIRFNAFHRERGHVFQSRYKSLLIEDGRPLLGLVNYIHLNPVRAGLQSIATLREHALSSYPKFFARKLPSALVRSRFLAALEFPDSPGGTRRYAEHLALSEESDPALRDKITRRYCRGWAIASQEFRDGIKEDFAATLDTGKISGSEHQELREHLWRKLLAEYLESEGKTSADIASAPKSAPWKVRIARQLRTHSTATNPWIAAQLSMGHPSRVCNLIRMDV